MKFNYNKIENKVSIPL